MLFKVITFIAPTVAVLAAPTPDSRRASNGMGIPLTKHSSQPNAEKTVNIEVFKSHVASHSTNIIRGMNSFEENMSTPHPSPVKWDRSRAGVDLISHDDEAHFGTWYGIISIGTPAKFFTVQFDTGSGDLFIPASTGDKNCRSHPNVWDPASSASAKALNQIPYFTLEFMDGATVEGEKYTDNVTITGFTTIGVATTYSAEMAAFKFAPDGLLGLAFPFVSADPVSPLFHTLFDEGKLLQPMFSLILTASGGELYVCGKNEVLYIDASLTFTPVTSPAFWQFNIDNIKVDNKIVLTNVQAIIDTGAVFIYGDRSRVLALHQAYGGNAFEDNFYTFPCKIFPSVTLTIGGKPFLIPAEVLNQGDVEPGSSGCFSGIVAPPDKVKDFWTTGTMFLQLFYTVFDFGNKLPQVGFATLAG